MSDRLSRRRYVAGTGAALTIGTLAGCSGGGDGGDGSDGDDGDGSDGDTDVPSEIDEYLADARQYDGSIADHTGESEVTIEVGTGDTGFAFTPAAARVDAGTTVVWEWTGNGGGHNVVSAEESDAEFDSGEAVTEAGTTFEQTFEDPGIQLYYCAPHQGSGMLAAIEVVEA